MTFWDQAQLLRAILNCLTPINTAKAVLPSTEGLFLWMWLLMTTVLEKNTKKSGLYTDTHGHRLLLKRLLEN